MDIINSIEKHIKILKYPLLDSEDEIIMILKKRLTKKEFKTFFMIEDNKTISEVSKELKTDPQRVEQIYNSVIKKLNQEKLKQEITQ
jgi:DNA-directed RNA polymerase sigma subunit (sigma70/sigma32)